MSIRLDATRTLAFQVFGLGAGLLTNVLVARLLGPDGKGLLSFIRYAVFVAVVLGGFGLQTAAVQYLGKKRYEPGTVSAVQIVLGTAAGLLTGVGVVVLVPLFQDRMDLARGLILPLALAIALVQLRSGLSGIMLGLKKIVLYNLFQALVAALWIVACVVILWALRSDKTVAAFSFLAIQVVVSLLVLGWVLLRARPSFHDMGDCAKKSLGFGLEAYLANVLWVILLRVDGFFLGYLQGSSALGYYSVAVLMGEVLWFVPRSLNLALNPQMATDAERTAVDLAHRAVRIGLWSVGLASLVLGLLASPLIRMVFGAEFLPSVQPLLLILPGIVAAAVASPVSLFMTQHKGRPRINALVSGVALAVNVALCYAWIPDHGARGAAGASAGAYGLMALFLLLIFRKEKGFSWSSLLLPKKEDLTALRGLPRLVLRALREGAE